MKKIVLSLFLSFLFASFLKAQAPEGINYQAVARDASGNLMTNASVIIRITILSGAGGTVQEYQESHGVSTNQYGLFSLQVGKGAPISGTFSSINWGGDTYFVQVELDDGSGFVDLGKSQMMSVPYALYAKTSGSSGGGSLNDLTDVNTTGATTNQVLSWNGTAWVPITTSGGTTYNASTGLTLSGTTFSANNTVAIWNADQLQGRNISTTVPSVNQVLGWNGSAWTPQTVAGGGTTYSAGSGLSLSGTTFSATSSTAMWNANQLQGRNISTAAPSVNQVLGWNGSAWVPQTVSGGGGTTYSAGTGITLSGTTFNANINSALWNANKLQNRNISAAAPSTNQVLKWNGSSWAPATDAVGTSPWTSSAGSIYRSSNVGIGGVPSYRFHVVHNPTNATNNRGLYVDMTAYNNATTNSFGMLTTVTGTGSLNNVGMQAEVDGSAATTGANIGGSFFSESSTSENVYGVRSQATDGGTVRNYGIDSRSNAVSGTFNIGGIFIAEGSSANTNYGMYAISSNAGTGLAYALFADGGANNDYAGFFNGDVNVTGTFTNPSDRRLKKEIQPLQTSLDKINSLNVYTYKFDAKGDYKGLNLPTGLQYGFIAQELEEVFPTLVKDNEVPTTQGVKEGEDVEEVDATFKTVNSLGMIPILTKAIQEQQELIEKLEKRIAELENK